MALKSSTKKKNAPKTALHTAEYLSRKYGNPETKEGTVFKVNVPDVSFIMIRVKKGKEPRIVRGGNWNAKLKFDYEEGYARWETDKAVKILKHMGDKASYLKDIELKKKLDAQKKKEEKNAIALAELSKKKEELTENMKMSVKSAQDAFNDGFQRNINELKKHTEKLKEMQHQGLVQKLSEAMQKNLKKIKTIKNKHGNSKPNPKATGGTKLSKKVNKTPSAV